MGILSLIKRVGKTGDLPAQPYNQAFATWADGTGDSLAHALRRGRDGGVINPAEDIAGGWRDDGSATGRLRVENLRDRLVAVPLKPGHYGGQNNGAATGFAYNPVNLFPGNADGTCTGLQITVPASASSGNSILIGFWFKGAIFGIRCSRDASYGGRDISCKIDGVAYPVPNPVLVDPVTLAAPLVLNAPVIGTVIATDLDDDAMHYAEIMFTCALTGSARQWALFGWLLDARAGYQPVQPGIRYDRVAISLTANTWAQNPTGSSVTMDGVRKVQFCNTGASAAQVSVGYTSGTADWTMTVPAKSTVEWDPGGIVRHGFYVMSDTTGVTAKFVGGC